jgi:hypothetical protein
MDTTPKKPLAALILAKVSKDKPDEKPESDSSDMGLESAIDEMFDAIKSGDKEAFAKAFKDGVSMCDNDSYDEEAEEK